MKNNKVISFLSYGIGYVFIFFQLFGSVASADYLVYQVSNVQQYDIYEKPPAVYQPIPEPTNRSPDIGKASYYGIQYNGRPTASGETYDMYAMTAAHRTLPFGTQVKVTNLANGKSTIVRVNDRGPYAHGRVIDLSVAAAKAIGSAGSGTARVSLEVLN